MRSSANDFRPSISPKLGSRYASANGSDWRAGHIRSAYWHDTEKRNRNVGDSSDSVMFGPGFYLRLRSSTMEGRRDGEIEGLSIPPSLHPSIPPSLHLSIPPSLHPSISPSHHLPL